MQIANCKNRPGVLIPTGSRMYEQAFQLTERPFHSAPYTAHYFAAHTIQDALSQAKISIERGTGPVVVIGDGGTGKSLMLSMLSEQYTTTYSVINIACSRDDQRQDLLQSILFELDEPYKNMSEGELRLALLDYLKPAGHCPNGLLLLIDDAHTLSPVLLEEIRLITNFVRDGQPRVRLVIAGSARLEDNLTDPRLDSFNQRISARCYLRCMTRDETIRYITTHIERAGVQAGKLLTAEAMTGIHQASSGCPRFVNQICEQSLVLAATSGRTPIGEQDVAEAWRDVQGLPSTTKTANAPAPESGFSEATYGLQNDRNLTVLEFGTLDDEPANPSPGEVATFEFGGNENSDPLPGTNEEFTEAPDAVVETESNGLSAEYEVSGHEITEHSLDAIEEPAQDRTAIQASDQPIEQTLNPTPDPVQVQQLTQQLKQEHEQIDEQAQGSQCTIQDPDSQQPASYEDPFAETFEDEVGLADDYIPMFAQHNVRSLDVTNEYLETLNTVPAPVIDVQIDNVQTRNDAQQHSFDDRIEPEGQKESAGQTGPEQHIESEMQFATEQQHGAERQLEAQLTQQSDQPVAPAPSEIEPDAEQQIGFESDFHEQHRDHELRDTADHGHTPDNDRDEPENDGYVQRRTDEILASLLDNEGTQPNPGFEENESNLAANAPGNHNPHRSVSHQMAESIGGDAGPAHRPGPMHPLSDFSSVCDSTPGVNETDLLEHSASEREAVEQETQQILAELDKHRQEFGHAVGSSDAGNAALEFADQVDHIENHHVEHNNVETFQVNSPDSQLADQNLIESQLTESRRADSIQSIPIEAAITACQSGDGAGLPADDRDMIVVSQAQQLPSPASDHGDLAGAPRVTSTGNAKRMNYNNLFDQLRNMPNDQQ